MATRRPNAVVMSASATPAEIAERPPEPDAAMPVKAFTIPIVVPSRPTNGAVAPTVASTPRPRFSCDDRHQHFALDRTLRRVDVGDRDGAIHE